MLSTARRHAASISSASSSSLLLPRNPSISALLSASAFVSRRAFTSVCMWLFLSFFFLLPDRPLPARPGGTVDRFGAVNRHRRCLGAIKGPRLGAFPLGTHLLHGPDVELAYVEPRPKL